MGRFPTDAAIADAIHAAAELDGYSPEILPGVAAALTRAGADEDERGAVLADVQRVWAQRFAVWGC